MEICINGQYECIDWLATMSLTCFICQNAVDPDRLNNIELGAELRREQRIAYVKEP